MSTGLVAVRRNLAPGAVFFRQVGQIVEYSLDQVTWRTAFVLPRTGLNVPDYVVNNIENLTLNEFLTTIQATFAGTFTTTDLDTIVNNPATRLEQNLCAGAWTLAATFVSLVNYRLENDADAETALTGAGAAIAEGALELIRWKFKTRFLESTLRWIGRAISGARVTAGVTAWWESLDNVPDLTDCDLEGIACAIYQSLRAGGTVSRETVGQSLITHDAIGKAQACGTSNLNTALVEWFSEWIDEWPELWSAFLAGLTDQEFIGCSCGGCDDIIPWDCEIVNQSGYKLLNGGVQSAPTTAAYTPTNYKYLWLRWVPPVVPSGLVDRIELTYATTQYQKSSSLNWGTTTVLGVDCLGLNPVSTGIGKQINEVAPVVLSNTVNQGGLKTFIFDFSAISQTGTGLTQISMSHRLAYAVSGVGADTVFIGGRVCYQGGA